MKFISGIRKEEAAKDLQDIKITIPIYHRTSISFFTGSEVFYIYRTYESGEFNISELILTPIKPDIWHRVRKVTLNAKDSPGIINTITSKLRDLKINVNIEEALTTQIGGIHTITLIIDISIYIHNHPVDHDIGAKVPQKIIDEIEEKLKGLINPQTGEPIVLDGQVYIKELTFLESIADTPGNFSFSKITGDQFNKCADQRIKIRNGVIILNQSLVNSLKLNHRSSFYYSMFSDTEDKYIKLLFFDSNQTVAFIDIFHQDVYGAIAEFTEIIYKNYKFNILASYSHQQMQKETAHWFALIDISNKKQEFFTKTLKALQACTYGEETDPKRVLEVFLSETNTDDVDDKTILRFGQNRKNKDQDETSIFKKKRELLEKKLNEFGVSRYLSSKDAPGQFITLNKLHNTESLRNLVSEIIAEKKERKKKVIRWAVSLFPPIILLWILMLIFPQVHDFVYKSFEHLGGVLLIVATMSFVYLIHKISQVIIK